MEKELEENEENFMPEDADAEVDSAYTDLELAEDESKAEIAELKEQLLRVLAENDNIRKRAKRDVEEGTKYAVTSFARDIVNVSENLSRALESIPSDDLEAGSIVANLRGGVEMTFKELLSVMERHGIKRLNPVGEKFDHNYHQAISQVDDPNSESGTIMQVLQAGYTISDRLLRPAMVVVAKGGSSTSGSTVDTEA